MKRALGLLGMAAMPAVAPAAVPRRRDITLYIVGDGEPMTLENLRHVLNELHLDGHDSPHGLSSRRLVDLLAEESPNAVPAVKVKVAK